MERKEAKISAETGIFLGKLFAFNSSLKLFHWSVTGKGSYAKHIALDQAIGGLIGILDRLTETSIAMLEDVEIAIPATKNPDNIVMHVESFYDYVESNRKLFPEDFSQSILDDYQETIQQLLYRLKRLE